ncbi:MAG TPA: pirin family protein [Thermoplasmata archaeon]|nr:pirin family protein [Thermoplasmata archaeon]
MSDSQSEPVRGVAEILPSRETIEGAGVHLHRAFGNREVPRLDPFLLLDDFRSENPLEYAAGFPWHPHRGIETVTYMLDGFVEHEDSIGNKGVIGGGDVQWMTAGSGIIHQEMPKPRDPKDGFMGGFQLWVNLPRAHKMTDPRYQEVQHARIPEAEPTKGVRVRVISGEVQGVRGPVRDIAADPAYFDVRLAPGTAFDHPIPKGHTAFAYVLGGKGRFDADHGVIDSENLVIFRDGEGVRVEAAGEPLRFLFVAGKPIGEPVAWWGPIVMNTRQELETAIQEYQEGTFIKVGTSRRAVS